MGPAPLPGLGSGARYGGGSKVLGAWMGSPEPSHPPGSLSYLDQLEGEAFVEDAVDAGSPRQFIGVDLVP